MTNPQSSDWNNFWVNQETNKLKKPSWSKQRIIKVIEPYLQKKKKVLDAGCGSGFFSKYFCDQGMKVVSLDYADTALEMTEKMTLGRARIIKRDLLQEDLAATLGEKFDIIFSDGLLEHFTSADQNKIMKNFISVLSPSGILITFVPNRWSPWELIRPLFMPGIDETPFVLRGLVRLNTCNGLSVLQTGGINTFPFFFSPDQLFGRFFGMLLYTIAEKNVP